MLKFKKLVYLGFDVLFINILWLIVKCSSVTKGKKNNLFGNWSIQKPPLIFFFFHAYDIEHIF